MWYGAVPFGCLAAAGHSHLSAANLGARGLRVAQLETQTGSLATRHRLACDLTCFGKVFWVMSLSVYTRRVPDSLFLTYRSSAVAVGPGAL